MQIGSGKKKATKCLEKWIWKGLGLYLDGVWDGLGPLLGALRPPSGSQVGHFGFPGPCPKHPKSNLLPKMLPKRLPRAPRARFWSSQGLIFELPSSILSLLGSISVSFWNHRTQNFSTKTAGASVTWKVHMYFLSDDIARKAYRFQGLIFELSSLILKPPGLDFNVILEPQDAKFLNQKCRCKRHLKSTYVLSEWRHRSKS